MLHNDCDIQGVTEDVAATLNKSVLLDHPTRHHKRLTVNEKFHETSQVDRGRAVHLHLQADLS